LKKINQCGNVLLSLFEPGTFSGVLEYYLHLLSSSPRSVKSQQLNRNVKTRINQRTEEENKRRANVAIKRVRQEKQRRRERVAHLTTVRKTEDHEGKRHKNKKKSRKEEKETHNIMMKL
jgi:hypothetical protein